MLIVAKKQNSDARSKSSVSLENRSEKTVPDTHGSLKSNFK